MLEMTSVIQNAQVPVTIIRIEGNVDTSNYQNFQEYLDERVANGARHILLDFKHTGRITSAGLRVIHNLFHTLRDIHKDVNDEELRKLMSVGAYKSPYLKVTNLSNNVAEVFRLAGFEIYIEIFDDEAAAVVSFH
jgi:anti-anti-sigma factor